MLNKLAKNQYVKIIKSNLENSDIEYGVVLNDENEKYDIMSIGFENKNGKFVEYPTNVENLVQSYTTQDAQFDEVKENEVRRKMNIWLENNYKSNYKIELYRGVCLLSFCCLNAKFLSININMEKFILK